MVSALTAQKAFLSNFENVVNRRVDIREDIKQYQDTLSYASSKVDYSVGENICMLLSDMNLNIRSRTVRYNKILVSDGKCSLGKYEKDNALVLEPVIFTPKVTSHKVVAQPILIHELAKKPTITYEDERAAFILFLTGGFAMWFMFR